MLTDRDNEGKPAGAWEPTAVPAPYADFLVDPRRPWRLAQSPQTWRGRRRQARLVFGTGLRAMAERVSRLHYVGINFQPTADPRPRYGYGRSAHPQLLAYVEAHREQFAATLDALAAWTPELLAIPVEPQPGATPAWQQAWLPSLDAACLYSFVRDRRPASFVEVGSGWSTRFVARAIRDGGLGTLVTSIDPAPRAEVDVLCDRVLRCGLESADLSVFEDLVPGDVVFIDNSHRSFTNSDVTVFFLDVLPRLPHGVLVGIHDITLPADYPPGWNGFHFNEQYLLASYLLGGAAAIRLEFAALYAASDEHLGELPADLIAGLAERGVPWFGSGFWFTVDRSS
jgi:hypothetical protein